MELNYLRIFNTLAVEQSFTKTAEFLHISQPAISMQIKKLEESLEVRLFDRLGNKVLLNENGKLLFEATKRVFAILEEAENHLLNKKETISGSISIGGSNTPGTYILPRIVGEFKRMYPLVSINLHIANTSEIAELVNAGHLDFAVNGGNQLYPEGIHVEKLMDDPIILAVSASNKLAGRVIDDISELEGIEFLAHEKNSRMHKLVADIIEDTNIQSKIGMTLGSIDAVKQAVYAGLGVAPIPASSVAMELDLGILSEFKIKNCSWSYPYSLIWNRNKYLTPAAKKLMELAKVRIGDIEKGRLT